MKHKVKAVVEVEKRGFFGQKRKVQEKRNVWVDGRTYKKMKRETRNKPYSLEEMIMYDILDDEDW